MATLATTPLDKPLIVGPGVVIMTGSFAPAGSGTITANRGKGWTVSRTSTGLFRVTLATQYACVLAAVGSVQHVTAAALFTQFAVDDPSGSTAYVDVRVVDGSGTVQDITADADSRVNFVLFLATSPLNAT